MTEKYNPFRLQWHPARESKVLAQAASIAISAIEKLSGLSELACVYDDASAAPPDKSWVERVLARVGVDYQMLPEDCSEIPRQGPAIVVANHPFGGIEGLLFVALLRRFRPDVKILANYLLHRIPELRDSFIFVDPFASRTATRKNLVPLREAISWVTNGGLLAVFPSGTVSHFQWKRGRVTDPEWSPVIARLIRIAKAPVVPAYFNGSNGILFQLSGMLHPLLRTMQLPRELVNKRGKTITLQVGSQIPFKKIEKFSTDEDLLSYLRLRTYILSSREDRPRRSYLPRRARKNSSSRVMEAVVAAVPQELLSKEVESLPAQQLLVDSGEYGVFFAKAQQIPNLLFEIGRLRELTFRAVNEGTGRSIDLDRFDNYYIHLFTWNRVKKEVVGAYRLVDANMVLRTYGVKGLYTHTLFAYNSRLLEQMGHSLELGRSFVRTEYQRNFNSLHLLWKGIAHYVVRYPHYHGLFGTVSISSDYDAVSRYLIVSFLRENKYIPELARLIRARNPLRSTAARHIDVTEGSFVAKDISDVSELVTEIELNEKSVPVLLRQYLRLGGKLLGFNIDKGFGDVLDGLIYIDMRETDSKILERYMSKEGLVRFYTFHSLLDKLEDQAAAEEDGAQSVNAAISRKAGL